MLLTMLLATAARAEQVGDLAVWVQPLVNVETLHGYRELSVTIDNENRHRPHRATVSFPPGNSFMGDMLERVSATTVIAPGGTVRLRLYQPPLPIYSGNSLQVRVDRDRPESLSVAGVQPHASRPSGNASLHPVALVSRSLNQDQLEQALLGSDAPAPKPSRGGRQESQPFALGRAETEVDAWSPAWLAYTPFDGVVLDHQDLARLGGDVREALQRYVECGGSLLIFDATEMPFTPHGPATQPTPGLITFPAGFGRLTLARGGPGTLNAQDRAIILGDWEESLRPWRALPDAVQANKSFPVIEDLSVPVRSIVAIILLFSILIGPLNIFLTTRFKRPIWLLWTIPALSAVTCALVIAYALLSEGITPTIRTHTVTLLDQPSRRAATLGAAGYYSPLTQAGGLRFEADTELTPLLEPRDRERRTVDWSAGQQFDSGWITARIPSYFCIRKSESRRERLSLIRRPDGGLDVVNGLGAPVDHLVVVHADGRHFRNTAPLPAGQRQTLRAEESPANTPARTLRALYGEWTAIPGNAGNAPPVRLLPNSYFAVLPASPFFENALPGKSHARHQAVVIGRYEPEDPS